VKIERLNGSFEEGLTTLDGEPVTIVAQVYSPVMDEKTCDACAKWDGFQFLFPPELRSRHEQTIAIPNHACTSAEGCRCVWVGISDRETPA
jgi:hypothetical protein